MKILRPLFLIWFGLIPVGAFLDAVKSFFSSSSAPHSSLPPNQTPALTDFLKWFVEMGGTINPHVTLASFEIFGNGLSTTSSGGVSEDEIIFKASSNMILTRPSIAKMYLPHSAEVADTIIGVSDDNYAIATQFVVECAIGDKSKFAPYMKVLPKEVMNLEVSKEPRVRMKRGRWLMRGAG